MSGVLAAALTELGELEAASGRLFVLRRRVIALLTLATLQGDNFTHLLILPDFPAFLAGIPCRALPRGLKPPDLVNPHGAPEGAPFQNKSVAGPEGAPFQNKSVARADGAPLQKKSAAWAEGAAFQDATHGAAKHAPFQTPIKKTTSQIA